jgi:4-amino-4-deoxy-L-arabinose transferase-like glycosyltransferase
MFLLVALAALLRLSGYNFSLPYIDHPDEPAFYLTGLEWRGVFDNQTYLTGYPPLYIWLNIIVQVVLEPFGIGTVAATIQVLRLISIVFNLLTLIVIGLTARRAAGVLAGWVAGASWAISPLVIRDGVYATPDPLLYLLVALAVWLAVEASAGRWRWCIWSVVAGALAILDKYYILTAVVPGMLVALSITLHNRRQGLRILALQFLLLLITVVIAIFGISVLPREGAIARESGLNNVLNLERVLNNIYYAVYPLQPIVFLIASGGGVAAYLVARRYQLQRVRLEAVLFCLIILTSVPWLAASFSLVSATERMKDVLPATTNACVLLGIAVGQISLIIPARYGTLARYAVALPLLLVFVPQLSTDLSLIQERQLPDNRVALRQWADDNLEPGTVLVDQVNHKTFNPFWGGIEGKQWFDWWISDSFSTIRRTAGAMNRAFLTPS